MLFVERNPECVNWLRRRHPDVPVAQDLCDYGSTASGAFLLEPRPIAERIASLRARSSELAWHCLPADTLGVAHVAGLPCVDFSHGRRAGLSGPLVAVFLLVNRDRAVKVACQRSSSRTSGSSTHSSCTTRSGTGTSSMSTTWARPGRAVGRSGAPPPLVLAHGPPGGLESPPPSWWPPRVSCSPLIALACPGACCATRWLFLRLCHLAPLVASRRTASSSAWIALASCMSARARTSGSQAPSGVSPRPRSLRGRHGYTTPRLRGR